MRVIRALLAVVLLLAACSREPGEGAKAAPDGEASPPPAAAGAAPSPNKNAYFGDLHVHTRYSFDAFIFGTTADANQAYEFAKGGALQHPAGFEMKLDRPLDFQAVTDHGMYLGMLPAMVDPESIAFEHPEAEGVRNAKTVDERRSRFNGMFPYLRGDPGTEKYLSKDVVRGAWAEIIEAAERHNAPRHLHHLHRLRVHLGR